MQQFKEIYYLHIWEGGDSRPMWEVVDYFTWSTFKFNEGYLRTFKGKRATVATFTTSTEITREQALKCATDWMAGNYVTTNINLDRCDHSEIKGTPH